MALLSLICLFGCPVLSSYPAYNIAGRLAASDASLAGKLLVFVLLMGNTDNGWEVGGMLGWVVVQKEVSYFCLYSHISTGYQK